MVVVYIGCFAAADNSRQRPAPPVPAGM